MCWVMPPNSPATTSVSRIASRSLVLPWSTWPITVTTGGRVTSFASSMSSTRSSAPEVVVDPDDLELLAEVLGHQGHRLVGQGRGGRGHLTRHEQDLDDLGRRAADLVGDGLRRGATHQVQHVGGRERLDGAPRTAHGATGRGGFLGRHGHGRRGGCRGRGGSRRGRRGSGGRRRCRGSRSRFGRRRRNGPQGCRASGPPSAWACAGPARAPAPHGASVPRSPCRRTPAASARGFRARWTTRTCPRPPSAPASPATPCWRPPVPSPVRGPSTYPHLLHDLVL